MEPDAWRQLTCNSSHPQAQQEARAAYDATVSGLLALHSCQVLRLDECNSATQTERSCILTALDAAASNIDAQSGVSTTYSSSDAIASPWDSAAWICKQVEWVQLFKGAYSVCGNSTPSVVVDWRSRLVQAIESVWDSMVDALEMGINGVHQNELQMVAGISPPGTRPDCQMIHPDTGQMNDGFFSSMASFKVFAGLLLTHPECSVIPNKVLGASHSYATVDEFETDVCQNNCARLLKTAMIDRNWWFPAPARQPPGYNSFHYCQVDTLSDYIKYWVRQCPGPPPSPTPRATNSPTVSPSASVTASYSQTQTASPTGASTPSAAPTAPSTQSPSGTAVPSTSQAATTSPSSSQAPTTSASGSAQASPSAAGTRAVNSPTATQSSHPSTSASQTPSQSAKSTPSSSAIALRTVSSTPSTSTSFSSTRSASSIPSPSANPTQTSSHFPTSSPVATPTASASPAALSLGGFGQLLLGPGPSGQNEHLLGLPSVEFCQSTASLTVALTTGANSALSELREHAKSLCGRTGTSPRAAAGDCACPFMENLGFNFTDYQHSPAFLSSIPKFLPTWAEVAICERTGSDLAQLQYASTCEGDAQGRLFAPNIAAGSLANLLIAARPVVHVHTSLSDVLQAALGFAPRPQTCDLRLHKAAGPASCSKLGLAADSTMEDILQRADASLQSANGLRSAVGPQFVETFCASQCFQDFMDIDNRAVDTAQAESELCQSQRQLTARAAAAMLCSRQSEMSSAASAIAISQVDPKDTCSSASIEDTIKENLLLFEDCSSLSVFDSWERFVQRVCLEPACAMRLGQVLQQAAELIQEGHSCPENAHTIFQTLAVCPALVPRSSALTPLKPDLDCDLGWEGSAAIFKLLRTTVKVRMGEVVIPSVTRLISNLNKPGMLNQLCSSRCNAHLISAYANLFANAPAIIEAFVQARAALCTRDPQDQQSCLAKITPTVDFFETGDFSFDSALQVQGAISLRTQSELCQPCHKEAAMHFSSALQSFMTGLQRNSIRWWQAQARYLTNGMYFTHSMEDLASLHRLVIMPDFLNNSAVAQLTEASGGRSNQFVETLRLHQSKVESFKQLAMELSEYSAWFNSFLFLACSEAQALAANATEQERSCALVSGPQFVLDQFQMIEAKQYKCVEAPSMCCPTSFHDSQWSVLSTAKSLLAEAASLRESGDELVRTAGGPEMSAVGTLATPLSRNTLFEGLQTFLTLQSHAALADLFKSSEAAADAQEAVEDCGSQDSELCDGIATETVELSLPPFMAEFVEEYPQQAAAALLEDVTQHISLRSVTVTIKMPPALETRSRQLLESKVLIILSGAPTRVNAAKALLLNEPLVNSALLAEMLALAPATVSAMESSTDPTGPMQIVEWAPSATPTSVPAASASPSAKSKDQSSSPSVGARVTAQPPQAAPGVSTKTSGASDLMIYSSAGGILVVIVAVFVVLRLRARRSSSSKRTARRLSLGGEEQSDEGHMTLDFVSPMQMQGRRGPGNSSNPLITRKQEGAPPGRPGVVDQLDAFGMRKQFQPYQIGRSIPPPPPPSAPASPQRMLSSKSPGVPPPPVRSPLAVSAGSPRQQAAADLDSKGEERNVLNPAALPPPLSESPLFGPGKT